MYRFLILFFLFIQSVTAQPIGKAFTFTGTIANTLNGYVFLSYIDSANHYIQDSNRLNNGRFSFTGYISSPQMAMFYLDGFSTIGLNCPTLTMLFIEPGTIEGYFPQFDFKHSKISGSVNQLEYAAYALHIEELEKEWKKAFAAYKKEKTDNNFAFFKAMHTESVKQQKQYTQQYIRQHPASYVSGGLLQNDMFNQPYDSLKVAFSHLAPSVQNGVEGRIVGEFIHKEESIAVGKPAPDFMQPDSSGVLVWLHDFKGRYVLLDIWASWCVPCRKEHPYLRQAYTKYKNKGFTILSLSMDEERFKLAWLEAIRKDTLTWPQLCDFKAWTNTVVSDYNVLGKGIPASFLINPQGIIVAMNLRGKTLEEKLEKLLGNSPL